MRWPLESMHVGNTPSLPCCFSGDFFGQMALASQRFVRLRHVIPSGHTKDFCGHSTAKQLSRDAAIASVASRAAQGLASVITSYQRAPLNWARLPELVFIRRIAWDKPRTSISSKNNIICCQLSHTCAFVGCSDKLATTAYIMPSVYIGSATTMSDSLYIHYSPCMSSVPAVEYTN